MAETNSHRKERELQTQITAEVERGVPGIEVLAVELLSPTRFCVYVDHPQGVDHALCGTVTDLLRGYLEKYTVDVSSPGLERPLRKPAHFRNAVGRRQGPSRARRRPRVCAPHAIGCRSHRVLDQAASAARHTRQPGRCHTARGNPYRNPRPHPDADDGRSPGGAARTGTG